MLFFSLYGKPVKRSLYKYIIKWDEPSKSKFQFKVKQLLKPFWKFDIVTEEFLIPASLLRVDFINFTKHIAVEVQGSQHGLDEKKGLHFFHGGLRSNYLASLRRDITKANWLQKNNLKLVEIIESDLKDLDSFYKKLDILLEK